MKSLLSRYLIIEGNYEQEEKNIVLGGSIIFTHGFCNIH